METWLMSLLTATQGTPNRVFSLLRLLSEAGTPLSPETIAGWLSPHNKIGNNEVIRPKEALEQTLSAARSLRLISDASPTTNAVDVPATIEEFADLAHRHLCDSPETDANTVVLKVFAWFVLRAEHDAVGLHRDDREALVADIDKTFPRNEGEDARTFNPTKFKAWARWVAFLGLGMELPNTPFWPSPVERVLRELRAIAKEIGYGRDIDFRDVQQQLVKRTPYLDGGEIFVEMVEKTGWRPRGLSRVLSGALRELHLGQDIKLTALGDSARRVPFAPDPNDLTGLPGANRICIFEEASRAV
jgi:hypothetical protein